jgi:hypothetical protein
MPMANISMANIINDPSFSYVQLEKWRMPGGIMSFGVPKIALK